MEIEISVIIFFMVLFDYFFFKSFYTFLSS
jgi:hypothetical protein